MNTVFRERLKGAGINFSRYLISVMGAVALSTAPEAAQLLGDTAKMLGILDDTKAMSDDMPAQALAVETGEKDGGFPGAARPGSPAAAVNGHHEDTTAEHNRENPASSVKKPKAEFPSVVSEAAPIPVAAPVETPEQARLRQVEENVSLILSLLQKPADIPATPSPVATEPPTTELPLGEGAGV